MTSRHSMKTTGGHRPARALILVTALTLLAFGASRADAPPTLADDRPPAPAGSPLLISHNPGVDETEAVEDGLRIGDLDIDVDVVGGVARTVAIVRFENPTNADLEADFTLDLPAGSVISGYGLDVGDKMIDGVLAGHRLATQVYEKRLERRVDPGLAEVSRENAFHTRVYPVSAHRSRAIRIEFVTPVDTAGAYVLPLTTAAPVGAVRLHVSTDAAKMVRGPEGLTLASKDAKGGAQEASAEARDRPLAGALRIESGAARSPVTVTRHHSGDSFIQIDDAAPASSAGARQDRVRLYWDTSLSRRDDGLAAERDLVARYLAAARPRMVDVVFFADGDPQVRTFAGASEALAAIDAVAYRGATSLAKLLTLRLPTADGCVMVSDGNVDLDAYKVRKVGCPLFTVSTAADANHGLLTALARRSGGEHLDLAAMPSDMALGRLMRTGPRVLDVTTGGGADLDYALLPASEGRFRIVAPMPDDGEIRVTLAGGAARSYSAEGVKSRDHDGAGDLWAVDRLAAMSAADQPDEDRVLAFARRYDVASTAASFVVLETAAEYVELKTPPPAGFGKEGLAAYREALDSQKKEEAEGRADRLGQVIEAWREQTAWWNTEFKPKRRPLFQGGQQTNRAESAADSQAAAAAPPPPAPAASSGYSGGGTEVTEVVVTGARMQRRDYQSVSPVTTVGSTRSAIEVEAAEWNPDRPYLKALDAAPADAFWTTFSAQEVTNGEVPAFYFDVAEWLFRKGRREEAVSVVLSVMDLPVADITTLTILADRLQRYGEEDRSVWLYERLIYLQPELPQPRRNLALALIRRADHLGETGGDDQARRDDYSRAMDLLNEVITRPWDGDYDGIEMISLMEANRIVPTLRGLGADTLPLDRRLVALMDVDLRITLEWNTDDTDMDLWVDEPSGERAIYDNPKTAIGGRLSNDMTAGYGPEEYLLHRAPDGVYHVQANVFASDRLNPNGATVVRAHLYRDWGRPTQREETFEIELKKDDDGARLVGTFTVRKGGARKH